ncbi:MAG TPA: hypothetical protein VN729_09515 [Ktedonobacteraceae bacterium]|nr:hypothetical protein [Ktedonobacteraceae bacterium]
MSDGFLWPRPKSRKALEPYFPLDDFFKQARKYLKEVKHTQEVLQDARTKFNGITDIWQYHCDFTLEVLKTLDKTVHEFCSLAKQQEANFPAAICQYWYKLVIALYHIDGESHTLQMLLMPHHVLQQSFARYIFGQREEIYLRIGALMQNSNDFCQEMTHLLNIAQFLSRQDQESCKQDSEMFTDAHAKEFVFHPTPIHPEALTSIEIEEVFDATPYGLLMIFPSIGQQPAGSDNSL